MMNCIIASGIILIFASLTSGNSSADVNKFHNEFLRGTTNVPDSTTITQKMSKLIGEEMESDVEDYELTDSLGSGEVGGSGVGEGSEGGEGSDGESCEDVMFGFYCKGLKKFGNCKNGGDGKNFCAKTCKLCDNDDSGGNKSPGDGGSSVVEGSGGGEGSEGGEGSDGESCEDVMFRFYCKGLKEFGNCKNGDGKAFCAKTCKLCDNDDSGGNKDGDKEK